MASRRIPLLALVLVAAACGGSTATSSSSSSASTTTTTLGVTTTTEPPGFTVVSDDGDLEIDVPFEAMAEDPGITIRVLDPEEYPAQLAGAEQTPGTVIYSMEPEGLTFEAPVRVTRRLSASNFGDLADLEVPVAVMMTTDADGSFEVMGDLRVQRDGDDIYVSGETMHFSPAVTIYGKIRVRFYYDDQHRDLGTEPGHPIYLSPRFTNDEGQPFESGPISVTGVGYTRNDDAISFQSGEFLGIDCLIPGEYTPRGGVEVEFDVGEPENGEPTIRGVGTLAPGTTTLKIKVKNVLPLTCFAPDTSIQGTQVDAEIASDHPGGVEWVPNGDFLGGNSAAYGWFNGNVRLDGAWVGLIGDRNGNGIIDSNDAMFPVYEVKDYGGMIGFVAPLFSYGDYFIYWLDGKQFDWNPGEEYGVGTAGEILPYLETLYRGMGRFDSAIGVITVDGAPFVYRVDSSEEVQSATGAVTEIFTPPLLRVQLDF